MKVTITEFLRKSGEYLQKVDDGKEVVITSRVRGSNKEYKLTKKD